MTYTLDLPYRLAVGSVAIAEMARPRRMTLPTIPGREDPIFRPATKPCSDPGHGAAFIFMHGLGDDAEGLEGRIDKLEGLSNHS